MHLNRLPLGGAGEEQVDQLDGQVERLVVKLEALLHLHHPVHEQRPHPRGDALHAAQVVVHGEQPLEII